MAYQIDYEALSREPNALDIVVFLVDAMARPGFNLWRVCHACTTWQAKDGLDKLPSRPGAKDCTNSCNGCWYSILDEKPSELRQNEECQERPNYKPINLRRTRLLTDIQFSKHGIKIGKTETA